MNNPNIKRNLRYASAAVLTAIGITALKDNVEPSTPPKPNPALVIKAYPVQEIFDGDNMILGGTVQTDAPGTHIKSTSFRLASPNNVPAGVSIGQSAMTAIKGGEKVTAPFTAPSNQNQQGDVAVQLSVVESDGATVVANEEIPYDTPPAWPK